MSCPGAPRRDATDEYMTCVDTGLLAARSRHASAGTTFAPYTVLMPANDCLAIVASASTPAACSTNDSGWTVDDAPAPAGPVGPTAPAPMMLSMSSLKPMSPLMATNAVECESLTNSPLRENLPDLPTRRTRDAPSWEAHAVASCPRLPMPPVMRTLARSLEIPWLVFSTTILPMWRACDICRSAAPTFDSLWWHASGSGRSLLVEMPSETRISDWLSASSDMKSTATSV